MKGVKAVYKKQYKYKSLWLYGIAEPLTGETFFEELPKLNREIFQSFMNRFSEKHKHCLNIIISCYAVEKKLIPVYNMILY